MSHETASVKCNILESHKEIIWMLVLRMRMNLKIHESLSRECGRVISNPALGKPPQHLVTLQG
jgi:hypothetical protein